MQHHTKAIRVSLLNEQVDALAQLGKDNRLTFSQALIQLLQTTTLNAQNGTTNTHSNTPSHQHIDGGLSTRSTL
jgi:chromosome condensin MukBEF ATPase and DNA-binding subunit MukB